MSPAELKAFLDRKVAEYNTPAFIAADPISVPHRFTQRQDIEIAGFFAALFAWGNRTTIINKSNELLALMDGAPHQFITQHEETDLKRFLHFKHRTFNPTDVLYMIEFFRQHYQKSATLEDAFVPAAFTGMEDALNYFHTYFFSLPDAPPRTRKHIAAPFKGSTCKRINMYLRWMVRTDNHGVDFGLWKKLKPSSLIIPVDLHVARVARRFGLLERPATDWLAAVELTERLRAFDADDPVKYDFALFSLGVGERF
ncbi:MAG: TIGR02757 family protein [Sphingobacteriales bacterium]|nr:MAG: TIGR02757 family protein [Sphingobacteriales bacterium]